jgi:outer membrane protein assembly factor BamB
MKRLVTLVVPRIQAKRPLTFALAIVTFLLASPRTTGAAPDWPQWRGTHRDGRADGLTPPKKWPSKLRRLWKVEVGEGHAAPIVVGSRVYVHARRGEDEVAQAFELKSGASLWAKGETIPYEMSSVALAHGKGPKSTPVFSDGRLYTQGITGVISSFDAASGERVWRKEFADKYPRTSPNYGTAASPIIADGLCIGLVGGHDAGAIKAFDAKTGALRWSWDGDGPSYASPVVVSTGGVRELIAFSQEALVSLDLSSGALRWKLPFKTSYAQNSVTPLVQDGLLIYSGLNQGVHAVRLSARKERPQKAWSTKKHPMYMSSPVIHENFLYGMTSKKKGSIFCLDAATGETRWQSAGRQGENVAVVAAAGVLWLLSDKARLTIAALDPKAYRVIAQYDDVAESLTWAHLTVIKRRVLIKDKTTLHCYAYLPKK